MFELLRWGAIALDIVASSLAAPAPLADRQDRRLRALLRAAVRGSRLYRDRFHGYRLSDIPLTALPPVSKAELMDRFEDWVCDPRLKLAELRTFTSNPERLANLYLDEYVVWESSGTGLTPGIFVQDAQAMAVYDALEAIRRSAPRSHWIDPLYLAQRTAFVGATNGHFASMVSVQRLRQSYPWVAPNLRSFSVLQSTPELVEQLNRYSPTIIATYPTAACLLADQKVHGDLKFAPAEVWTGGETLTSAMRKLLELTLGCTVRNNYGASEFLTMGWECSHGRMHLNSDWVILEAIDEHGQTLPMGQRSHSSLLTNLANHVQPLIRYELGDQITMHEPCCGCGSSLPVIEVQGRTDESLSMAGLNGKAVTLLPMALTTILEEEAGVYDFQLRQRDEHTLVFWLNAPCAAFPDTYARCIEVLQRFTAAHGVDTLQVIADTAKKPVRGRSGKVQRIMACPRQGASSSLSTRA